MLEQSQSNMVSQISHTNESLGMDKAPSSKKKMIRKQRGKQQKRQPYQLEDDKNLTRQQKKQLQKQKNRIAAQVSRDNRKKYIQDLQAKIDQLETQIDQQLCSKCQANLLVEPQPENFFAPDDAALEPEEIFLRRQSSRDSINSFGNIFLIFMISIAMFSFTGSFMMSGEGQMKDNRILHPVVNFQQTIENPSVMSSNELILQSKNSENFNLQKQQCFYDFLKTNEPEIGLYTKQFHDRSIIVCKNPQIYPKIHKESENTDSLLGEEITIFMSGPQMKELKENSEENDYSLQGIYRMELQIKTLQKVFGTNALS